MQKPYISFSASFLLFKSTAAVSICQKCDVIESAYLMWTDNVVR